MGFFMMGFISHLPILSCEAVSSLCGCTCCYVYDTYCYMSHTDHDVVIWTVDLNYRTSGWEGHLLGIRIIITWSDLDGYHSSDRIAFKFQSDVVKLYLCVHLISILNKSPKMRSTKFKSPIAFVQVKGQRRSKP